MAQTVGPVDGGAVADEAEVENLLLALGVALTITADAVSEVQNRLLSVATAYGYPQAEIVVLPTFLFISIRDGDPARVRMIDSTRQLRLDQASEVIAIARSAADGGITPQQALVELRRVLHSRARFSVGATIAAYAMLTLGIGLVLGPAPVDLWHYLALGALVGTITAMFGRYSGLSSILPVATAALVSAIAFLADGGNEYASLRLTIPPLVTFLPGALLTMGVVDLAMGQGVTGSRFIAGLLQLGLLAIAIVIGAELVGNPHGGPVAGAAGYHLGAWAGWLGVAIFGIAIYVYNCAPRRSLPWLLIVLFSAWGGQLLGKQIVDTTLSGFVGAAVMVPVAHIVSRAPTAPPAHVMFLPAFWLLVPGTLGLIGVTEAVGEFPVWRGAHRGDVRVDPLGRARDPRRHDDRPRHAFGPPAAPRLAGTPACRLEKALDEL